MAKITRLPSGAYHTTIYAGKSDDGKRKYKSITADTPKEVKRLAALYELQKEKEDKPTALTLEQAMHNYTKKRINILSPTTYRLYDMIERSYFKDIQKMPVANITNDDIQEEIDKLCETLAPKSVRNAGGYLIAVLSEAVPDRRYSVDYPKKIKAQISIPSDAEMQNIFEASEGTRLELPVLFGACLGMRRSEILGLKWENIDIDRKTLTVKQAIVYDKDNNPVEKPPKSFSGSRTVIMPDMVIERLKRIPEAERSGPVVNLEGFMISEGFARLLEHSNIRHYRFHDLRHYFASVMYGLGVPPKYAAQRMGHADETMINRVYAHIMQSKVDEQTEKINAYFNKMQNKMQNEI